ncbi:MAG: lipid-A-disaccharide synthase, partial [Microcystaceae cyanobacterium]
MQPVDILILSNGPGEVTTWVRPVVKALRQKLDEDRSQVRISVILSPCPNATGKEAAIALSYPEVERVQSSEHFFPFLLWGKTAASWDWREKGVVVFLGGDQFFAVAIAKRLGYRTVVYAEWDARWYHWIDRFGIINSSIIAKIPPSYHPKFTVVGDLMADVSQGKRQKRVRNFEVPSKCKAHSRQAKGKKESATELIGLLPGSKPAKLAQGVPLCLAIAQNIQTKRPQTRFIIPVAPTLDLQTLARFADPSTNPIIDKVGGVSARLIIPSQAQPY